MAALALAGCATVRVREAKWASESNAALDVTQFVPEDTTFAAPYIDRDEPRSSPYPHRYVHGGFTGTDTRFSFHFPARDAYRQRFFQYITPVPDSETVSQGRGGEEDRIGLALSSGAIFVETNGGGPGAATATIGQDQTIGAYRANAASARLARHFAQQVYGAHRTYGYAYGGSGGAYRTIGSLENTKGVWDGAVPFVVGSPMAIPNMFTVRLNAMRVVGDRLDDVVDALDAGGSGDPYATLAPEQRDALREVTRMGFPPQSWYAWRTMGPHAFGLLFGGIRMADQGFFSEFWNRPGYAGHDHPELYVKDREQLDTTVTGIVTMAEAEAMGLDTGRQPGQARGTADLAWQAMGFKSAGEMPVAFRLADTPKSRALLLADLVMSDGRKLNLRNVAGAIAIAGINDPRTVASVKIGDRVRLDNSDILAVQSYHRHQVPPPGQYPVWDQFRDAQGKPLYPQRPVLLGPLFTKNASGVVPTGRFEGRMILLESMWDREALPWQGDWYRRQVEESVAQGGGGPVDGKFRIWMTDRALHGDHASQDDPTRVVSYLPVLNQALRDLAAWVQDGTEPPASTYYSVVDGQVTVPPTAAARGGIQPVVTLAANGHARADVRVGEAVTLAGTITVPPGAGSVTGAAWHFGEPGAIFEPAEIPAANRAEVTVTATFSYPRPGTYFATLRGVSERTGDRTTAYTQVTNLARVRIVVH